MHGARKKIEQRFQWNDSQRKTHCFQLWILNIGVFIHFTSISFHFISLFFFHSLNKKIWLLYIAFRHWNKIHGRKHMLFIYSRNKICMHIFVLLLCFTFYTIRNVSKLLYKCDYWCLICHSDHSRDQFTVDKFIYD